MGVWPGVQVRVLHNQRILTPGKTTVDIDLIQDMSETNLEFGPR